MGSAKYQNDGDPRTSGPGFGVTDHEIGHQWWPMMVGVNETWYGWMDEGFNQYMNILSAADSRGGTWSGRGSRPWVRNVSLMNSHFPDGVANPPSA